MEVVAVSIRETTLIAACKEVRLVIHNGRQHETQSKTALLHPGGDANEEAEDEDTVMDTETL
jgi:hypothetical protein